MEKFDYNSAIIARFVDLRHFLGIVEGDYENTITLYRGEALTGILRHCQDALGKIERLFEERDRNAEDIA